MEEMVSTFLSMCVMTGKGGGEPLKVKWKGGGLLYQNSSNPIVPLLSMSNILIIILTVWGSKLVKSPFTSAARSSFSVS